jgi:hypothetical protein
VLIRSGFGGVTTEIGRIREDAFHPEAKTGSPPLDVLLRDLCELMCKKYSGNLIEERFCNLLIEPIQLGSFVVLEFGVRPVRSK